MQTQIYVRSLVFLGLLIGNISLVNAYENERKQERMAEDTCLFSMDPELPIERFGNENEQECGTCGIWLPEDPVLFRPLLADPRKVDYSAGWRFNDQAVAKDVIDVSFGDIITFYRWCDIGPCKGQLDISLEGGLWAVFDPLAKSAPLVNADYFVGVPISYAFGPWAFRLRGYHISSHVGDEFLIDQFKRRHVHFKRKNPSAEYIDFFVSNYISDDIRVYGGVGVVAHMDESFPIGRFFASAGAELHLSQLGFIDAKSQVYGRPFYGMHFHFQTEHEKHINQTYVLGYEWGKLCGLQRILRAYVEYHDGYSWEGQFFNRPTNYLSIRVSYGY